MPTACSLQLLCSSSNVSPVRLAEKLGLFCRTAERRVRHRLTRDSSRAFQQLRALRVIAQEQIVTQTALAERLRIDPPAASRLVDRLEKDGLLERCPGSDRRCVHLKTTKEAEPEIAALTAGLDWLEAQIRSCLPPDEARTFERLLDRINAVLASSDS